MNTQQADDVIAEARQAMQHMTCANRPGDRCQDRIAYQHYCRLNVDGTYWERCPNCRCYAALAALVDLLSRQREELHALTVLEEPRRQPQEKK